jgi:hypothetical protein
MSCSHAIENLTGWTAKFGPCVKCQLAAVTAERDAALLEAHRLREIVQQVDVRHIRLRDTLRRACDGWEQQWRAENNGDLPHCLAAELAELRRPLAP